MYRKQVRRQRNTSDADAAVDSESGRLLAAEHGEQVVVHARNAGALFEELQLAHATLDCSGEAVMSTDAGCRVTYMNSVAQILTGWSPEEAAGHLLDDVFRVIDAGTGEFVQNPAVSAILEDKSVGLPPNCILRRRDGTEAEIEDVAAPVHDLQGLVSGAVMVFRDVSAARALSSRASYLAQHDSLTDLPNRTLFSHRLTEAIVAATRDRRKLSVLLLDLDRFWHINDSWGRAIGDRLLQSVAQRLLTSVRGCDVVSRHSGNEFAILFAPVAYVRDMVIAERLLRVIREVYCIDRNELHVTASIGVATYPDDGNEAETLLKSADLAMHHAKESGRDNYQFFAPEMGRRALVRRSLESELRYVLEKGKFALHYQPIVNLQTGAIVGSEALLRCRHPRHGLGSPARFIPVAEECGFIVQIGRWVLREACRQAQIWNDGRLPPVSIAVNVSTTELRASGFVVGVWNVLRETGLEPSCLELELTETFLLQDAHSAAAVLQALKDLGVRLSLDDFGTGYSSLSHLKCFPIDTLKIDQSFVRGLVANAADISIVSAVITMGRNLNMRVVAEGVETPEQLLFLQERSCSYGQGFLFSPPLAAGAMSRRLQARGAGRPCFQRHSVRDMGSLLGAAQIVVEAPPLDRTEVPDSGTGIASFYVR